MREFDGILISGKASLKEISRAVRYQESFFWQLHEIEVITSEGIRYNKAVFSTVSFVPPEFVLLGEATAPPAGMRKQWTGLVRYNGAEKPAILYRAAG